MGVRGYVSCIEPSEGVRRRIAAQYERLEHARRTAPLIAIGARFVEIDGFTQGGLLAIELFTTVIPLMILGFGYFTGFAKNASVGNVFIRQLGLDDSLAETVRATFGSARGLQSTWTVFGLVGFLVWGIPMAVTVAAMYAKAWRRETFSIGRNLLQGSIWFVAYLAMIIVRERIGFTGHVHGGLRWILVVVALIPVWIFWSVSPVLLVRDGDRSRRALMIAGLAGVVIDGVILPIAARVALPLLLKGWAGFGPIGVAMTLMTWCGVMGFGWVVTACAGAVLWERTAPTRTVVESESESEFESSP